MLEKDINTLNNQSKENFMETQNSNSPRLVVYYNGNTNLSIQQIAALPYTDIIFAFLVPSGATTSPSDLKLKGEGAWYVPNDLSCNIHTLKDAGKNVLISFGGALGITSDQYKAYSENVDNLVSDLVDNWIKTYGFNGVDIDFEDTSAFQPSSPYDGVDFLVTLTQELAKQLPPEQNIITHAPQTPYWGTSFVDEPYVKIWNKVSNSITWINNQFYNNNGWDGTSELDIQWYKTIAQTTKPQKLMLGMPVGANSAEEGYLPLSILIPEVIQPLQQKYPTEFGGVMGWELSDDHEGTWGKEISNALMLG